MKKLSYSLFFLLFANIVLAQADWVKKKIEEKYALKNVVVIEPFNGGHEIDYTTCVNYLIKFPDGSFKVFDKNRGIILFDQFIHYQSSISYSIALNTKSNGNKEWIIYETGFPFYGKTWNPIRIPYETYDKILLGDNSEYPDLIGVKGSIKTRFGLDFANQKIIDVEEINFYGDASFLELGKTYFPIGYGIIAPYELEKSDKCVDSPSPYCNNKKKVYRYSSKWEDAKGMRQTDFDSIIALLPDKRINNLIVRKEGFLHLYNLETKDYELKKIDGYTDDFAYNNQGIYKFFTYSDPTQIFLPIQLPKDVIIEKKRINNELIYTFKTIVDRSLTPILKINFTLGVLSILHHTGEEKISFEEYAQKANQKRIGHPLLNWGPENPVYDNMYNEGSYELKYKLIKNSEFFNPELLQTNYYENSAILPIYYSYFKFIPNFFDIDYLEIERILIESDKTYQGVVLFYDNFLNLEGASPRARLSALNEIIAKFPKISELYYYRSLLNYYLKNNQEALNDMNTCLELKPNIQNYIRRMAHSSYSFSSRKKNKMGFFNDLNSAIHLLLYDEDDNYWIDYYLRRAKINFLMENKFLSKKTRKEEICLQINVIFDLINNQLIKREDFLQGELEQLGNIKQKNTCK